MQQSISKTAAVDGSIGKLTIKKWLSKSIIIEMICAPLVLLFMYTAISKLLDYQTFQEQLGKSPFVTQYAGLMAIGIPALEIAIGVLLSSKRTRLVALYLSLFLMTAFTSYIYAMLHYSYYIPCSCGGVLAQMDWHTHFWFNSFFLILSIAGVVLETERRMSLNKIKIS